MHTLSTREATGVFDPGNPGQRSEIYYAGWPGRYASFYTNEVPTDAQVNLGRAAGLGSGIAGLPIGGQVAVVAGLALVAYFGTKALRKRGLLGARVRRRRR